MARVATPRRAEQGFTIAEAVLVIGVLVGLVVAIVVSVGGLHRDGDRIDCSDERRRLAVAAEVYRAQEGRYPADVAALEEGRLLDVGVVTRLRIAGTGGATSLEIVPVGGDCR